MSQAGGKIWRIKNPPISKQPLQVSKSSDKSWLLLSKGGHDKKGNRHRDVMNRQYTMLK